MKKFSRKSIGLIFLLSGIIIGYSIQSIELLKLTVKNQYTDCTSTVHQNLDLIELMDGTQTTINRKLLNEINGAIFRFEELYNKEIPFIIPKENMLEEFKYIQKVMNESTVDLSKIPKLEWEIRYFNETQQKLKKYTNTEP